jgi:uncharacterized protein (DUF1330 family)
MTAKAYWVAHVTVTDPDLYAAYRREAAPAIAAGGGVIRVLAGEQVIGAGNARPQTVVVEFPSLNAARTCYFGEAYQATVARRDAGAEVDLVIVEGVMPS